MDPGRPPAPLRASGISRRPVRLPRANNADPAQQSENRFTGSVSPVVEGGPPFPHSLAGAVLPTPTLSYPASNANSSQIPVGSLPPNAGGEGATMYGHVPALNGSDVHAVQEDGPSGANTPAVEWFSINLWRSSLIGTFIFESALLLTIITLLIFSTKNSGFVRVSNPPPPTTANKSSRHWQQAILWTSLPNFVFQILKAIWEAMVIALLDREPYIELKKARGALAEKSIILDYRTRITAFVWFVALKNKHLVGGICGLLGVILSFAIVPLTAHLFEASSVVFHVAVPARFTTFYNDSSISSSTDLRSGFDTVSAIFNFGGNPLPWTTERYAFPAFALVGQKDETAASGSANMTVATIGYSAFLDCVDVTKDATIHYDQNTQVMDWSFTDRSCSASSSVDTSKLGSLYVYTWATKSCSIQASYSRFSLIAGLHQKSNNGSIPFSNLVILSCIPGYSTTPGDLTVTPGTDNSSTTVASFDTTGGENIIDRGYAWIPFEEGIHFYITNDPTDSSFQTDIGRLIYTYSSRKVSPNSPLDSTALKNATGTVFTAVFSVFASTYMFQPLVGDTYKDINFTSKSSKTTATVSSTQTRLFVVWYIAIPIIIVLLFTMVFTVIAGHHTYSKPSILHEEPSGLLSYAAMLKGCDSINELVDDAIRYGEKRPPPRGRWERLVHYITPWGKEEPPGSTNDQEITVAYRGRPVKSVKSLGLLREGRWRGRWQMRGPVPLDEQLVFVNATQQETPTAGTNVT
ncbi:hypothetical protein GP486_007971 [Trichoglossum hirsutum]|uniref:Uncharacterized protein n=1 Tax=Trichoglossum hirsutum TaxID=265104 RepID=A0A9P8IEX3_9PEZI|nr:hypothetical protein GP486_007971 [Trichoglossum hirsutum]